MTRRTLGRTFALAAVLGAALLAGCRTDLKVSEIKTLLDDPSRFDKQVVHVAGSVTKSFGALGYGVYTVDDGTGSIAVVTKENGAPREGARVGVEGEFRSAFTLNTQTVAVIMEHGRYSPGN
jgi:uncharacterized protein (DUF2141 family)